MAKRQPKKPQDWIHDGVEADYHSIIGGPITGRFRIEGEPVLLGGHTYVVRLQGKSGCFACDALTKVLP